MGIRHSISRDVQDLAHDMNTNLRELQGTVRDSVHETNVTARALGMEVNQTINDRSEQAFTIVDMRSEQVIDAMDHNVANAIDVANVRSQQLLEATDARVQESIQIVGRELDHGINVVHEGIQDTNETLRRGVSVAANLATTARVATVAGAAIAGVATYSRIRQENERNELHTETMRHQSTHCRLFAEETFARVRKTQEGQSAISHFYSVVVPTIKRTRAHIAIKCSDQAMAAIFTHLLEIDETIRRRVGHFAVGVSLQSMINEMEEALPSDEGDQEKAIMSKAFVFLISTGTIARRHMELHPKVSIGSKFTQFGTFVGETTDSEPRHALSALSTITLPGNKSERLYLASDKCLYNLLCTTSVRCPIYVNGSDLIACVKHFLTGSTRDVVGASTGAIGQAGCLIGTKLGTKAGFMGIVKLTTGKCIAMVPGFGVVVTTAVLGGKVVTLFWDRSYTYLIEITGTISEPYKQFLSLSEESRAELKRRTKRSFYYE